MNPRESLLKSYSKKRENELELLLTKVYYIEESKSQYEAIFSISVPKSISVMYVTPGYVSCALIVLYTHEF